MTEECIFCKIIKGEIPCSKIYEDNEFYAFLDIRPIHPGHALVIPKTHCRNLLDFPKTQETDLMELLKKISKAVIKATDADGINIGINNEPASGQEVFHAHFHIIPRFEKDGLNAWPRKEYEEGQMNNIGKRIVSKLEKSKD